MDIQYLPYDIRISINNTLHFYVSIITYEPGWQQETAGQDSNSGSEQAAWYQYKTIENLSCHTKAHCSLYLLNGDIYSSVIISLLGLPTVTAALA